MKKIIIIKLLLVAILTQTFLFLFSACHRNESKVLDKEVFTDILAELMVVENLSATENQKLILTNQIFKKYGVTPELFKETRSIYKKDGRYWMDVYKAASEKLKARSDSLDKKF